MPAETATTESLEIAEPESESLPLSEISPESKPKLNANHKRFIRYRVSGLSKTAAYIKAYKLDADKREYAYIAARRLLIRNDLVRKEINRRLDESTEEAQRTFALGMADAASTIVEIMQDGSKDDSVRLRAAEYIIDRGLGKPRTDVNLGGEIKGDITIVTAIKRPDGWRDGNKSE